MFQQRHLGRVHARQEARHRAVHIGRDATRTGILEHGGTEVVLRDEAGLHVAVDAFLVAQVQDFRNPLIPEYLPEGADTVVEVQVDENPAEVKDDRADHLYSPSRESRWSRFARP